MHKLILLLYKGIHFSLKSVCFPFIIIELWLIFLIKLEYTSFFILDSIAPEKLLCCWFNAHKN